MVCQSARKRDPGSASNSPPVGVLIRAAVVQPAAVGGGADDRSVASVVGWSGAVLEPPAVVAGLDDVAVVRQSVEQRRGHLGVAEHARPCLRYLAKLLGQLQQAKLGAYHLSFGLGHGALPSGRPRRCASPMAPRPGLSGHHAERLQARQLLIRESLGLRCQFGHVLGRRFQGLAILDDALPLARKHIQAEGRPIRRLFLALR